MIFISMKIKITEAQANRLKLLKEDMNPLAQFEKFCKDKVQEVNNLYLKVTSITISDILNKEVNIQEINHQLDIIERDLMMGNKRAYLYIDKMPDEGLDVRIDRANDTVHDKLTPLQLVTMDLEKLQLSAEHHSLTKPFSDIKPMDISGIQH